MLKSHADPRVTAKIGAWVEYLAIYDCMLLMAGGQAIILNRHFGLNEAPLEFLFTNMGYWGFMSTILCGIVRHFRRKMLSIPFEALSLAARNVAGGDFSVHLDPTRKDGKKDYVEVLFEDFNKMVVELGSAELMKNDFISSVSHEIKTPLAVMQNYASALQNPEIPASTQREYASIIISAAQRLNTLVSNILKLSKLDNSELKPTQIEFDLSRQLSECALAFEDWWERKNISFSAELSDKCLIRSNPELLEIVWNNLLSNALKFTEEGGSVTLRQTEQHGIVTVEIADTGCGMDEQTTSRIFDKFYQGDTSHNAEGNGLGLALVARVMEILGGQIHLQSQPGKGTVFAVELGHPQINISATKQQQNANI
ncbi:MAG: HAMP domain-containing histidine kinase [Clostridiales bacterium]|jgi:signal transduction histidine kinase|nr:HAMP domain-containing histidine kinase [Clostridiales bacterium]